MIFSIGAALEAIGEGLDHFMFRVGDQSSAGVDQVLFSRSTSGFSVRRPSALSRRRLPVRNSRRKLARECANHNSLGSKRLAISRHFRSLLNDCNCL